MELKTPTCYRVLFGTLDQGVFSEKAFKQQDSCLGIQFMMYDVNFSGRNVAVLLNSGQENDCCADKPVVGLNSASIRYNQCAGIDLHHHWGRLSLEKLKNEKGITLVDSKPRMVTTVGDVRYQERLDSFFKKTSPGEVVYPLFAEKGRFDPETLAAYGWEYSPPEYNSVKEAESSWRYFVAKKYELELADHLLLEDTANDAIRTDLQFDRHKVYGFEDDEVFPERLVCKNVEETISLNRLVEGLKRICQSNLLSVDEEAHKAVVVKLAGCHDFLLTTLENKDKLCFEPFSDHDLFCSFRNSWQEHIEQINSVEFERNTLPILEKILPAMDKNYKVIVDFVEMVCGTGHAMIEVIEANNISWESIKERLVEFQSVCRELVLIQKQIEFYEVVEKRAQQKIDQLSEGGCVSYFTDSREEELQFLNTVLFDLDELFDCSREWFTKFNLEEKEKAISRLKVLGRKLFIAKFKIGIQSDLERMLISLSGQLVGRKYSSGNESRRNDYHRCFTITNEILALIGLNKPTLNLSGNRSLEPLDLAADLTFLPPGQKDRSPGAPR